MLVIIVISSLGIAGFQGQLLWVSVVISGMGIYSSSRVIAIDPILDMGRTST